MSDNGARTGIRIAQTVLVVDDHGGFRARMRHLLERAGYAVIEAADGSAALESAATALPDIALVDVHLPDMDGFTLARRLRSAGATRRIIVTSTLRGEDYPARASAARADAFVDKLELSATVIADVLSR